MHEQPDAFIAPYGGTHPAFASRPAVMAPGAAVLGRATIGTDARLGPCAVIRADGHFVRIGNAFLLGAHATVHIAHDVYPTIVGDGVTAEDNAVIHACEVEDDCFFGQGAVVLDGSHIGRGAVVTADSIVYPRSRLEGGWLYAGQPAKPVRRLEPGELADWHSRARAAAVEGWPVGTGRPSGGYKDLGDVFIAKTASMAGDVAAGEHVGIWYGCRIDAGAFHISIGASSNIQDNSTIRCVSRSVTVGPHTTLGHNVSLTDCEIGSHSLIGIGAQVTTDVVVEDDVLLAAGARTEPGQVLTSGWIWGGRPARKLSALDKTKRAMMSGTIETYRNYAQAFRKVQEAAGSA